MKHSLVFIKLFDRIYVGCPILLLVLVSALFFTNLTTAAAQDSYSGKITDNKNEPLTGVSVQLKNTTTGTTTDAAGMFKLIAKPEDILVISFIGFNSKEITLSNKTNLTVVLENNVGLLGEVVIVGSRGLPRTVTSSPVPVDAINTKELKSFAQVNVADILNYLAPSFNSNRQTVTDGTDHIDPASLRGLGPDQVLVLVNGKRRHNSALVNINGAVARGSVGTDMNVIPVAAIERVEVLRDGAAAQYGSDAIAGVINVVLKNNYNGLSASLTNGMHVTNLKYKVPNIAGGADDKSHTIYDGGVVQFDLSKGFRLGKNGSLTITTQYNERGKTNRSGLDNAPTIYLGSSGGFPGTPTGQNQTAFRTKLIADDAILVADNNYDRHNMVFGNSSSRNIGLFLNGFIPVGKKSELYFTSGYTYRTGKAYGNNRVPVSRAQQPLHTDGSLYYPNGFLPVIAPTIQDPSLIFGYKTGFGKWQMDISNTFGMNKFQFKVSESGNASLPNGIIPTEFDAGTLSFTQNTTNLDFVRAFETLGWFTDFNIALGSEFRYEQFKIKEGEVNSYIGAALQKSVPTAPLTIGGPAAGTTIALPGSQVFPGFQPTDALSKTRNSQGLYADFQGELFKRWLLSVAGRFENYSDFNSNVSGKFATRFKIVEFLSLRGSVSTGFRAPSLHQRYFQNTSTQFVSGLPSNTLTVNNDNPIARTAIGVDALRPETSTSIALGITSSYKKFTFTLDAYQIKIKDRIVYSGSFSRAILGFTPTDYPGINNVSFFANAANTTTKGIDIVASQKAEFGASRLTVTAALNFNENKVTAINSTALINDPAKNDPNTNPNTWFKNLLFDRQQQSRIEVHQPRSKINLSVSYAIGKFDVTVRAVRFGKIEYVHNLDTEAKKADGTFWNADFTRDSDGNAFIDQTFSALICVDLTLGYRFTKNLSLSIGANNLLDEYPDQVYSDPRNALGSVDYNSGRDASNRGRYLFFANQGGFNGRFVFTRLTANF